MSKIIVAGHSHTAALEGDLSGGPQAAQLVDMKEGLSVLIGSWPRETSYWAALQRFAEGQYVALIWGGNEHNGRFLFQPAPKLDIVCSARLDLPLDPESTLIPEAMVYDLFLREIQPMGTVLQDLAKLPCTVKVFGTPPPKANSRKLRQFLPFEEVLTKIADARGYSITDIPLTSPYVRLKLWHVLQDCLADIARHHQVPFIPVPAELRDGDGFLPGHYWADDGTHANKAYGNALATLIIESFRADNAATPP